MSYTLLASMVETVGKRLHDIPWLISRLILDASVLESVSRSFYIKASSPVESTAWT